jgi:hypothetical protein
MLYSLGYVKHRALTIFNTSYYLNLRAVVAENVQDNRVVGKNKDSRTFELSIFVFVGLQQTSLRKDNSPPTSQDMFKQLRELFQRLCTRYEESKHTREKDKVTLFAVFFLEWKIKC